MSAAGFAPPDPELEPLGAAPKPAPLLPELGHTPDEPPPMELGGGDDPDPEPDPDPELEPPAGVPADASTPLLPDPGPGPPDELQPFGCGPHRSFQPLTSGHVGCGWVIDASPSAAPPSVPMTQEYVGFETTVWSVGPYPNPPHGVCCVPRYVHTPPLGHPVARQSACTQAVHSVQELGTNTHRPALLNRLVVCQHSVGRHRSYWLELHGMPT